MTKLIQEFNTNDFKHPMVQKQVYEGRRKSIFPIGCYELPSKTSKKEIKEFEYLYNLYKAEDHTPGNSIVDTLSIGGHIGYYVITNDNGYLIGFYIFDFFELGKHNGEKRQCPIWYFFFLIPSERRKGWFRKVYNSLTEKHGLFLIFDPNDDAKAAAERLGYDHKKVHYEYFGRYKDL
ncbi:hypothetical protein ACFL17_07185 [Pseudomonadota bacterium]